MTLNSIDIIASLILLYVTAVGWRRGIIRFSIGFLALILSTIFSILYFKHTQNIFHSFLFFFIGSIVLSVVLSLLLSAWNKKVLKNKPPFILSRLLGALMGFGWSLSVVSFVIAGIAMVPFTGPNFSQIQKAAKNSYAYALIQYYVVPKSPALEGLTTLSSLVQNPELLENIDAEKIQEIQSSQEFQEIANNENIQNIINDQELLQKLQSQDIAGFLSDPKVQALMQDPELIKSLTGFAQQIVPQDLSGPHQ